MTTSQRDLLLLALANTKAGKLQWKMRGDSYHADVTSGQGTFELIIGMPIRDFIQLVVQDETGNLVDSVSASDSKPAQTLLSSLLNLVKEKATLPDPLNPVLEALQELNK